MMSHSESISVNMTLLDSGSDDVDSTDTPRHFSAHSSSSPTSVPVAMPVIHKLFHVRELSALAFLLLAS